MQEKLTKCRSQVWGRRHPPDRDFNLLEQGTFERPLLQTGTEISSAQGIISRERLLVRCCWATDLVIPRNRFLLDRVQRIAEGSIRTLSRRRRGMQNFLCKREVFLRRKHRWSEMSCPSGRPKRFQGTPNRRN